MRTPRNIYDSRHAAPDSITSVPFLVVLCLRPLQPLSCPSKTLPPAPPFVSYPSSASIRYTFQQPTGTYLVSTIFLYYVSCIRGANPMRVKTLMSRCTKGYIPFSHPSPSSPDTEDSFTVAWRFEALWHGLLLSVSLRFIRFLLCPHAVYPFFLSFLLIAYPRDTGIQIPHSSYDPRFAIFAFILLSFIVETLRYGLKFRVSLRTRNIFEVRDPRDIDEGASAFWE